MTLREQIFASCDRAVDNGYAKSADFNGDIYTCDPVVVAIDMLDCDATFEDLDTDDDAVRAEVIAHVRAWQFARRPR